MLCRALIAAVAVTCTLSHGRATQRLDRIKDLMCALLLSGMQKEDLDVSMLTKLQRHNVNIDDMNNEKILQECIQSRNNNSYNKVTNITETQPFVNEIKNTVQEVTNADLEIFKSTHTENYSFNARAEYKSKKDNIQPSKKNALENKSNEIIQNSDKQPKLESVLKLWQDTKMHKALKEDQLIQKPDSIKEQESKRSITESIHSTETDILNRLLANFLAKKTNISTKPTTTQKSINIDDMFEKLYSLRMQDMEKNSNDNPGLERSFSYLPIQRNARKTPIETENVTGTKREEPNNTTNISDALTLLNTFKSFNQFIPDAEFISNLNRKSKESIKSSRNPYPNSLLRVDTPIETNIEPKQEISQDMIKKIADSVKEIILKDLRKELHEKTTVTIPTTIMSTTTTQITTTREAVFQTILNKENIRTQDTVMKKFLELFEEIKSLKQNSIVIKSENEKVNNKDTNQKVNNKELKVYPQMTMRAIIPTNVQAKLPPTNQDYRIKQYPAVNSENLYNFAPQLHRYRSKGTIIKQPTINKQPTIEKQPTISKQEPTNLLPLTVQTTNIEILPIGIPLDKPPIRQNIIVTTKAPYRVVPIKNGQSKFKNGHNHKVSQHSEASKPYVAYKPKHITPRLSKELQPTPFHNYNSKENDDVIGFTLKKNEHSKYASDYYEKYNIGKYKSHSNSDEIPRFHEKLEKVERYLDYPEENKYTDENDCCNDKFRYSDVMVDCCNRKIASRQQMSLNNMKMKNKSFDDIHFKKFIQSQQKVTDMLERILGDKVHSVETA